MGNYVVYHLHSMLSNGTTNVDSITDFHAYVDRAKELGMKAMAFSEHGNIFGWKMKKEYIEKSGMKYIHAVEAYLTEDTEDNKLYSASTLNYTYKNGSKVKQKSRKITFEKYFCDEENGLWYADILTKPKDSEEEILIREYFDIETLNIVGYAKHKDNYHVILIAKNEAGKNELNLMMSSKYAYNRDDYHYYYYPRITFDELFNTSDNIIVTTACLGGVLHSGTYTAKQKMLVFLSSNKHRCYLEIQHHNCKEQKEYNKLLYNLSKEIGVPLIAGTDTHALNSSHLDGRSMLQKGKGVHFENEDAWDLSFKSYDELVAAYDKQNSLPKDIILEAIENTNLMADMIEPFDLDYNAKYPKLYKDSESVFKKKINEGVLKRKIKGKPDYKKYIDRIKEEYDVYKHNNAIDFMLLEENYKAEMRKKGIKYGYSRGSVSGSIIAYLLYITEIDSIKYNLSFSRFMNKERVSLADIDSDWLAEDREVVKEYLYNKEGLYCCDIVTFNTIALKGGIRDICRAFNVENINNLPEDVRCEIKIFEKECEKSKKNKELPKRLEEKYKQYAIHKEVPYKYMKLSDELSEMVDENESLARKKYGDIFKYVDLVNGVIVSVGNHPAGVVVSPFPVEDSIGTFTTSSDKYHVSVLNMKEIDSLNYVKLDILG